MSASNYFCVYVFPYSVFMWFSWLFVKHKHLRGRHAEENMHPLHSGIMHPVFSGLFSPPVIFTAAVLYDDVKGAFPLRWAQCVCSTHVPLTPIRHYPLPPHPPLPAIFPSAEKPFTVDCSSRGLTETAESISEKMLPGLISLDFSIWVAGSELDHVHVCVTSAYASSSCFH